MNRVVDPEDETTARNYVELLRHHDFDQLQRNADSSMQGAEVRGHLEEMAAMFPQGTPISVKVVGANTFRGQGHLGSSVTLEYEFARGWLLAGVTIQKEGGALAVAGLYVKEIPQSIETANAFTLRGKGFAQNAILVLAAVSVFLSLYASVFSIRRVPGKKKWFWAAGTLLGIGQLAVNWTTGVASFTPWTARLIPGGAFAPVYGPWTVYVSLPVGAIVFWFFNSVPIPRVLKAD